jgi:acyl-CoA thioesterase FadM
MSVSAFAERAASADAALLAYMNRTSCDCEECLENLLRDLMHWADMARLDFAHALRNARFDYITEVVDREVAA